MSHPKTDHWLKLALESVRVRALGLALRRKALRLQAGDGVGLPGVSVRRLEAVARKLAANSNAMERLAPRLERATRDVEQAWDSGAETLSRVEWLRVQQVLDQVEAVRTAWAGQFAGRDG